jgi:hypothetical protein
MGEIPETRVLQTMENTVNTVRESSTISKTDKGYVSFSLVKLD